MVANITFSTASLVLSMLVYGLIIVLYGHNNAAALYTLLLYISGSLSKVFNNSIFTSDIFSKSALNSEVKISEEYNLLVSRGLVFLSFVSLIVFCFSEDLVLWFFPDFEKSLVNSAEKYLGITFFVSGLSILSVSIRNFICYSGKSLQAEKINFFAQLIYLILTVTLYFSDSDYVLVYAFSVVTILSFIFLLRESKIELVFKKNLFNVRVLSGSITVSFFVSIIYTLAITLYSQSFSKWFSGLAISYFILYRYGDLIYGKLYGIFFGNFNSYFIKESFSISSDYGNRKLNSYLLISYMTIVSFVLILRPILGFLYYIKSINWELLHTFLSVMLLTSLTTFYTSYVKGVFYAMGRGKLYFLIIALEHFVSSYFLLKINADISNLIAVILLKPLFSSGIIFLSLQFFSNGLFSFKRFFKFDSITYIVYFFLLSVVAALNYYFFISLTLSIIILMFLIIAIYKYGREEGGLSF